MKKYNNSLVMAVIAFVFLTGCNVVSSQLKGYFSQKYDNLEEPQTDDERTLLGEFKDYLAFADSLATIWDGTDTINIRRYIYEIDKQLDCIEKASKFQNVRRSINTRVEEYVTKIENEIDQKFTKGLRNEMCEFHRLYYCTTSPSKYKYFAPQSGERIYKNTLNEYYVIRNNYGQIKKTPVLIEEQYQDIVDELINKGH